MVLKLTVSSIRMQRRKCLHSFKPVYFEQEEQMTIFDFLEDENGTT